MSESFADFDKDDIEDYSNTLNKFGWYFFITGILTVIAGFVMTGLAYQYEGPVIALFCAVLFLVIAEGYTNLAWHIDTREDSNLVLYELEEIQERLDSIENNNTIHPDHVDYDENDLEDLSGLSERKADLLRAAGYDSIYSIYAADRGDIAAVYGMSDALAARIQVHAEQLLVKEGDSA